MSNGNKTHISELVCLQVNPKKLSDKKLVQIYDRLVKKGKVRAVNANYQNPPEKVWYVKRHNFVGVIVARGQLGEFISRHNLNIDDFKNVRGGNTADIRAIERLENQTLPATQIKSESNQTLEQSILETVDELSAIESSSNNMDDLLNQGTFDTTDAVSFEETENQPVEPSNSILKPPAFKVSSSMMNLGTENDSLVYPSSLKSKEPKAKSRTIPVFTGSEKADIKLDATASIPIWRKGSTPEENSRNVENYIRDLKRIKALNVGKNDAWVINSSLVKSQRTEIYVELPSGADSDIEKFTEYIQQAYGLSKVAKRRALNNIKQSEDESPHAFLSRVCNTYFETRGEDRKTLEDCEKDSNIKFDLISLYLKGLSNPKVRVALKQKLGELKLATIAEQTRNIIDALSDENVSHTAVNLVVSGNNQINDKVDVLTEKLNALSVNMTKFKEESKKSRNYENRTFRGRSNRRFNRNSFSPYNRRSQNWNSRNNNNQQNNRGQVNRYQNNSYSNRQMQSRREQNPLLPPRGVKFNGDCYYCGLQGHSKRYCRKKRADDEMSRRN